MWYIDILTALLIAAVAIRLYMARRDNLPDELEEEKPPDFYIMENELNALYYERDLLLELASRETIGTDLQTVGTKELKTALRYEKQIHALNKKIEKLQNKLESG